MKPVSPQTRQAVQKMAAQNVRRPEIARALGISKMTVGRILKNSR